MKRFISIFLSIAVAVTLFPALSVYGTDESAVDASAEIAEQIADQFGDPSADPFDYTQRSAKRKAVNDAKSLPAKYDLRDVEGTSYVTHVKLQNPFGNCWGFAAICAAETSILGDKNNITSLTADTIDLSEKHLSYFAGTPINDPDNPQNGEGVIGGKTVADIYDYGGMALTATSLFSSGVGPVLESEDTVLEYKGRRGLVDKDYINNILQNYCYSANDDWTIPESLRFRRSFALKESYMLPSPASISEGDFYDEYEYNPAATAAIKDQLYQKRGVQIGYWDDLFNPELDSCGEYISGNWAQYTYECMGARHAVCIVGWDDTYPKENFAHPIEGMDDEEAFELTTPEGNGAWLVKNSWGSGEEAFPDKGAANFGIVDENTGKHTGYFWLSYYDHSIRTPEALDFENESDSNHITDQHNYMPVKAIYAACVDDPVITANVFKAGECEELQEVSCQTSFPGTEVTCDVYILKEGFSSPVDGILMDSVTETFEYGGFHRLSLNNKFTVMRGQSYSIVVTQKTQSDTGEKYAVSVQTTFGGSPDDICAIGVINKGESYLMMGDTWQDFSDKNLQNTLMEKTDTTPDGMAIDNFPIKGYAEKKQDLIMIVKSDGNPLPPFTGNEPQPAHYLLTFEGDANASIPENMSIEWKLNDGGDEIITLTPGRTANRVSIAAKKGGRAVLTITADGVGTLVYPINVTIPDCYIQEIQPGDKSAKITLFNLAHMGIDKYEIYYRIKGTSSWSVKEFDPDSNLLELTGLTNGKQYEIKARARTTDSFGYYYGDYSEINTCELKGDKDSSKDSSNDPSNESSGQGKTTTKRLKNNLKVSPKKEIKVKANTLKKKSVKIKRKRAMKVTGANGTLSFRKVSVSKKKYSKKIIVNKKTGKITLKKGLKKGTYTVKIRVRAAGNKNYKPMNKNVYVKIRVR